MLGQIDLASQSLFAGRYRVLRRIAAGGMGAVFEVVHVETQRRRALKVMLPELLANKQLRERFQMEARITANVESEYIVDVFDAGIDDATGMPFLVMELLNGEDLGKVQEKQGRLAPQQVVTYLRQVASALDKTPAAGIVHRDLKPENLFLTHREDGTPRVKILDFGISKVVTEAQTGANATRGLGTPLYMAPEQVLAQTVSSATDLYALGLIAYTLLVGLPYWQAEAESFDNPITFVVHTSKGATDSAVGRAAQVGHTLPPAFDAWFRRATRLDPTDRFRSAAELVSELATSLGVAVPSAAGPVSFADSSGAHGLAGVGPMAETMAARTAPGTGFDRQSTLVGAKRRRGLLAVGGAALALVVVISLAVFAMRTSASVAPPAPASASATLSEAGSTLAAPPPSQPSATPPSVNVEVPQPGASVDAPPTASSAPKSTPHAKSALAGRPAAGTKSPPAAAHPIQAPKYTRD